MKNTVKINCLLILFFALNHFNAISQEKTITERSARGCNGLWYKANNRSYISDDLLGGDTVYFNLGDSVLITSRWDSNCHTMGLDSSIDWYKNNAHYHYTYGVDSISSWNHYKSFYINEEGVYNANFTGHMYPDSYMQPLVLIMNNTNNMNVTGVEQSFSGLSATEIFPNPANNQITLKTSLSENENITLEFIDALGRSNLSQKININAGETQSDIDISSLKSGIYFLKIMTNNSLVVKRIVKENY